MILDNLLEIREAILDILEQVDTNEINVEEPLVITWDYDGVPFTFSLLIHEQLPAEVDFHESDIVH